MIVSCIFRAWTPRRDNNRIKSRNEEKTSDMEKSEKSDVPMPKNSHQPRGTKHLGIALSITLSFFVIELIGGSITNSLVLVADAWHMLNDASALIFAIGVAWIAERPIDVKKTFGYYRVEILAAFLNGIFLWVVVVFIFYGAIQRIQYPAQVESLNMLIIAISGLMANGLSALILSKSKSESLNVRGAFLHVLADAL